MVLPVQLGAQQPDVDETLYAGNAVHQVRLAEVAYVGRHRDRHQGEDADVRVIRRIGAFRRQGDRGVKRRNLFLNDHAVAL